MCFIDATVVFKFLNLNVVNRNFNIYLWTIVLTHSLSSTNKLAVSVLLTISTSHKSFILFGVLFCIYSFALHAAWICGLIHYMELFLYWSLAMSVLYYVRKTIQIIIVILLYHEFITNASLLSKLEFSMKDASHIKILFRYKL